MNPELPHLKALPGVRSANEERANRVGLAGNSGWHRERQKDARDLEALQLDGIEMSYGQFRTYVWRIRKKGVPTTVRGGLSIGYSFAFRCKEPIASDHTVIAVNRRCARSTRQYSGKRKKRDWFDYRPELTDPKKLI